MTDRFVGAFIMFVGIAYAVSTSQIRVGFTSDTLGPRAVPYLLAFFLVALSILLILRPSRAVGVQWPSGPAAMTLVAALMSFVGYAMVIELVGFVISSFIELAFLSLLFGARLLPALAGAAVTTGGLYALFNILLGLRLPVGQIFGG